MAPAGADDNPLKAAALSARLKIAEQALGPFEAAHRELTAAWTAIDTKAQGATAIAGVFLGAAISILTKDPGALTARERQLVLGITVALAVSVILALFALIPRALPVVDYPESRFRKVRDLLKLDNDAEFLSMLVDPFADERNAWVAALASLQKRSATKARLLLWAHVTTTLAVLQAAILVGLMLVN